MPLQGRFQQLIAHPLKHKNPRPVRAGQNDQILFYFVMG